MEFPPKRVSQPFMSSGALQLLFYQKLGHHFAARILEKCTLDFQSVKPGSH